LGDRKRRNFFEIGDGIHPQRPLRILVAEDNRVNQRLARVNLESWGHRVKVVSDGVEALEALDSEAFDLLILDSQMPRLGGLETAVEIRRREKKTGERVPIIAVTANVMKGYREECIAAGMDGYIAKPMRRAELAAVMEGAIPDLRVVEDGTERDVSPSRRSATLAAGASVSARSGGDEKAPSHDGAGVPVDNGVSAGLQSLLSSLGGNRQALREMTRLCVEEDGPRLLRELRTSMEGRKLEGIARAAHGFRGILGVFQAAQLVAAARELEDLAHVEQEEAAIREARQFVARYTIWAQTLRDAMENVTDK